MDFAALIAFREKAAIAGNRVVLTNGYSDLLHRDDAAFHQQSAALGDLLIVAVNNDALVRALKGQQRLADEIPRLRPDIHTKADDCTPETLDPSERAALEKIGAEIRILPFVERHSTTFLIDRAAR